MPRLPELQAAIDEIPVLDNASVRQQLAVGPVSESWLLEDRGQRMVLRIDTPLALELKLDRHAELSVLETVAAAGIGPQPLWADAAAGVLLTAYVPGPVWDETNVHDPACLQRLATTLRRLHGLSAAGPGFNPGLAARTYAGDIGTPSATALAGKAAVLADQLLTPDRYRALCHNDLVFTNIIGSDPVRLIDWEYAALGDPLFDFAVVVRHHRLAASTAAGFLNACLGPRDGNTAERFSAFCELYDLLATLWYQAVNAHDRHAGEANSLNTET